MKINLAVALFVTCGICAASVLDLVLLHDPRAVCNDGSPAGYYIQKGSDPTSFVLYLQGGGYCFDNTSCGLRWGKGEPGLMSSVKWPKTIDGHAILSSNATENPYWHAATRVMINYCSSDLWTGSKTPTPSSSTPWYYKGSEIISAAVDHLKENHGLRDAKEVLFTGSSAGGEGLLPNADRVAEMLSFSKVTVLVDSGWFLDFKPYKQGSCKDVPDCTEQEGMKRGYKIWEPIVNKGCSAAMPPDKLYQCTLGYHTFPFIKTDMFIFQYQFDGAQMGHDGIHNSPSTGAELKYAQEAAKNLTDTFRSAGAKGVFSPSCYFHTILGVPTWTSLKINGWNLADVFHSWRTGDKDQFYVDTCNTPGCNPTCP